MKYYVCEMTELTPEIISMFTMHKAVIIPIVLLPTRVVGSIWYTISEYHENDHYLLYNLTADDEIYLSLIAHTYCYANLDNDFSYNVTQCVDNSQ